MGSQAHLPQHVPNICKTVLFFSLVQVSSDLQKYMDSIQTKITQVNDMVKVLQEPDLPEPVERFTQCLGALST